MTKTNYQKACPYCHEKMIKNGFDKNGKQIWYCPHCNKHKVFTRKDILLLWWLNIYIKILLGLMRLNELCCCRRTYERHIKQFRTKIISLPPVTEKYNQILIDGVWISKKICILIARTEQGVIAFDKYSKENSDAWIKFLSNIRAPEYVVCDGQKGLSLALNECWSQSLVQRCQFHVCMNVTQKITRKPKTLLGFPLLKLKHAIFQVDTPEKVRAWGNYLNYLIKKFNWYLKQRSYGPNGGWWYTHKRDRSCIYQLKKLYESGDLFRWVFENRFVVNNTTNSVEGGVNAPLKDKLRNHKGARTETKIMIAFVYLYTRSINYNYRKLCQLFVA